MGPSVGGYFEAMELGRTTNGSEALGILSYMEIKSLPKGILPKPTRTNMGA